MTPPRQAGASSASGAFGLASRPLASVGLGGGSRRAAPRRRPRPCVGSPRPWALRPWRLGGRASASAAAFASAAAAAFVGALGLGARGSGSRPRRPRLAAASAAGAPRLRGGLGDRGVASPRPRGRRRLPRRLRPSRGASASATETSLRMSIRQPVSFAARRAFWPSRPMASESIRSGTMTFAIRCSSSMSTVEDLGRAQGVGDEDRRVVVPGDDVDLLAAELGHDRLDPRAALADRRADRVEALLAARDGDLRAAARLAGDRLDLDGAAWISGTSSSNSRAQEALVRAADEDLRARASSRRTSST